MAAIIVNLECITNMHVGNGDVNFNIIDNEVERDVTTGYPTINASGVKGALREYFERNKVDEKMISAIFGKENAGKLKFLCADMLALPMRASEGNASYYMVTTKEAVKFYKEKCQMFLGKEISDVFVDNTMDKQAVEGIKLKEKWDGKEIYIISDKDFKKTNLPVIARNKLDNGISKNLWYEEVVPHKALFTFVVLAEDCDKTYLDAFKNEINGKIVQFGGNASIGYGLCKVSVDEKEA